MWKAFFAHLPRGYGLPDADWQRRHQLVLWVLAAHVPGLAVIAVVVGRGIAMALLAPIVPLTCLGLGHLMRHRRRLASVAATAGLVSSSAALVVISRGAIEAHFHFFIIIGFIALYQDWVPFLFNILFIGLSHWAGTAIESTLIFNHPAAQANPWLWSALHAVSVLCASVGMMLFWRITEDSQHEKDRLARQLAQTEIGRQQFTSDLLVNLARRNQSMLYRQLDIINQLEESERDPDALAELFKIDHLATRIRRNAESLLVLSGEQPARTWSQPVPLRDVLRAAIAETEDLQRVVFVVDEQITVTGQAVTDLTHLIAELTENAIRSSPPDTSVNLRVRPDRRRPGGQLLTVEDCGVGMPPDEMAAANALLTAPPEIDLSVAQRLGFHVVARLAARHGIQVLLTATPGSGVTAVVAIPPDLLVEAVAPAASTQPGPAPSSDPALARIDNGPTRHVSDRHTHSDTPASGAVLHTLQPRHGTVPVTPASGDTTQPTPTAGASTSRSSSALAAPFGGTTEWQGWWNQPAEDRAAWAPQQIPLNPAPPPAPAVPAPRPAEPPDQQASRDVPAARTEEGLHKRVPQASLAPELRESRPGTQAPAPIHDTAEAAAALSRYQASREAARGAEDEMRRRG